MERSAEFRALLTKEREARGIAASSEDIMRPAPAPLPPGVAAFAESAREALKRIAGWERAFSEQERRGLFRDLGRFLAAAKPQVDRDAFENELTDFLKRATEELQRLEGEATVSARLGHGDLASHQRGAASVVALRLQTLAERIERVRIARRASEQRGARLRRAAESAAAVSLSGYRNAARLSPRDGAAAAAASAAAMASPESADGAEPAAEPRLQRENQALLEALRGDLDAALRTESRVQSISTLMNELSMHVDRQAETIDTIADKTQSSLASVQSGNRQLQNAMGHDASYRVGTLLFLVLAGLALLFLDMIYD